MSPPPLPIDPCLPEILDALARRGALVLSAEPGAGKTTRLPPALLQALPGEVLVLEPRRLAARLAAQQVARELGERPGERVGWQVRFERVAGPGTRLLYLTEGVLVRRLGSGEGALRGVSAVVLDEFHERHLETDLALVLLERLRRTARPDLRLVVMSATLDPGPLAGYLDAAVVDVPGRVHPVEIEHAARRDERPLEDQVREAVGRLRQEGQPGHTLVFLPGAGEIRRAGEALAGLAAREGLAVLPLHGRLSPEETEAALRPSERPKLILATNVAESSLTIDGVSAVIDAGLHRTLVTPPGGGLPALELQPISQASARQRAHRAGRQRPGRCLRLYTRNDHDRRPAADLPELLRVDLAPAVLALHGAGVRALDEVRWLDPPGAPALEAAERLLRRLGALDEGGGLTAIGRGLSALPLPPRLGRVLLEARARGVTALGARAAALLAEPELRRGEGGPGRGRGRTPAREHAPSDVLILLDLLEEAERARFAPHRLRPLGVDPGAARRVARAAQELLRAAGRLEPTPPPAAVGDPEEALLLALLAGHPDRVARRQVPRDTLALADGGTARLAAESAVQEAEWLVALSGGGSGRGGGPRVDVASAIAPDWLIELFPEQLEEEERVAWDPARERVEASWRLRFGALVVQELPVEGQPAAVEEALRAAALAAGPEAFCPPEALERLRRRLRFAREQDSSLPDLDQETLTAALGELCQGRRSFAELRQAGLLEALLRALGPARRRLDGLAPESVTLPGGRRLEITYEPRQPPWVASRLQDFFGLAEGPRLGKVPLVLHLLAPNKAAVSVTSDLAGFWARHYPAARRELSRRYPRHSWPEDPLTAAPPRPGRIR